MGEIFVIYRVLGGRLMGNDPQSYEFSQYHIPRSGEAIEIPKPEDPNYTITYNVVAVRHVVHENTWHAEVDIMVQD